jgi:hypothetical protein
MSAMRRIMPVASLALGLGFAAIAHAHFNLNMNVRVFHVEHTSDGLRVYLRTPMAYLVADRIGPVGQDGLPDAAPFTINRMEDGRVAHLVDPAALHADPLGLGRIVAEGMGLETNGRPLQSKVMAMRAYPIGQEPGFATLAEAKAALSEGPPFPKDAPESYVGDTIVDVLLGYDAGAPINEYAVSSQLDPGLPGQDETANLILDQGPGGTEVFRIRGLMSDPVAITRSTFSAASTFIWEGVRHILGGLDHVLFVLCIVLGATGIRSLISRITGFTVGHSVTLAAGFFGFVPSGAWFVPTVEIGIALSIIYAAVIAIRVNEGHYGSERTMFLVTCAIGMLHGLGFSFVLHEILRVDAPNIWQSLLAFNLGVEIGQLAIVLVTWPTLLLIRKASEPAWHYSRLGLATACIAVAAVWTGQRVVSAVEIL